MFEQIGGKNHDKLKVKPHTNCFNQLPVDQRWKWEVQMCSIRANVGMDDFRTK